MTAILTLLVVVLLAILTQRVASTVLRLTGVSRDLANFQARSALTGVGFTTSEAESVTQHPVRRRVIATLMLLGSAGVITAMASLILSFVDVEGAPRWMRLLVLLGGLGLLWVLSQSDWLERQMDTAVTRALERWTTVQLRDYVDMLHLNEDFRVVEIRVNEEDDWLAARSLEELDLDGEGVNVLGVTRASGDYVGAPGSDTVISSGDRVLLYGRKEVLEEIDQRRKGATGEAEHASSVAREDARKEREARKEKETRDAESPPHGEGEQGDNGGEAPDS